ncbi:MAG TPA: VTT domain-containing protein [Bryobacteraceae bacterium]|jgi:membrane protein DedA with SNARE-associated domain|nr:VTT domain-containing protein [Bryobacteraceae bacterium]
MMGDIVSIVSRHGYPILCFAVFLEAIGLPVPAALALLVAGATLPVLSLPVALATVLVADTLMFFAGRYTGWWLLGMLCRLSINPEGCILKAADSFYRRGRWVLVFAKFVPGINTMAPPLAGSMHMRASRFIAFDFLGASLYTGIYWLAGFLFADFLGGMVHLYSVFSSTLGWVLLAAFAGYLIYHAVLWARSQNLSPVERVSVAEVVRRRDSMAVYDVRSHGYYERGATRIPGSTRLDPNALNQQPLNLSVGKEIVLYCTCLREATSTKVARNLAAHGIEAAVIVGGFPAWKKAGLPLEPVPDDELVELPAFA